MRDETEDISSSADEAFSEGDVTSEEEPPQQKQSEGYTFGFLCRLGLVSKKEPTPTNDGDGVTKDDSKEIEETTASDVEYGASPMDRGINEDDTIANDGATKSDVAPSTDDITQSDTVDRINVDTFAAEPDEVTDQASNRHEIKTIMSAIAQLRTDQLTTTSPVTPSQSATDTNDVTATKKIASIVSSFNTTPSTNSSQQESTTTTPSINVDVYQSPDTLVTTSDFVDKPSPDHTTTYLVYPRPRPIQPVTHPNRSLFTILDRNFQSCLEEAAADTSSPPPPKYTNDRGLELRRKVLCSGHTI